MDIKLINKYCRKLNIAHFSEVDSTNAVARDLAREGAEEGTLVIADRQTGGKGRMGRKFFSYNGGIYMSLILRPALSPSDTLFITCAAAVAAAQTINEAVGCRPLIKWVNDIYVCDKKVCGILTEGAVNPKTQKLQYAILGIGINLFEPKEKFPQDLPRAAALLGEETEGLKEKIIGEFANKFFAHYVNLNKREFMKEYAQKSYLDGKEITFELGGETKTGKAIKINENGELLVDCKGKIIAVSSGDAQIKEFN